MIFIDKTDWKLSNDALKDKQEEVKYWMNVDQYIGGVEHEIGRAHV